MIIQIKNYLLASLILILLYSSLFAQSTTESICDDHSFSVLPRLNGQVIKVTCDTVYILNKTTFRLLSSSYKNFRSQSGSLKNFFDAADNYLYEYDRHEAEQAAKFDSLRNYFQLLTDSSKNLVNITNAHMQTINADLSSIQLNVESAREKISSAQVDIVKNERRKWWDRVKWGLGGLVIGIAATTILIGIK
ncbi:MAG: hypothetical protein H0W62_05155 [Chitinophagales bacterium]|nr:hypothetical protein [Chitinophagales bacterium]